MWCFARVLAHYPYVVLISVMVVSLTCLIITITLGDSLTFEEPMAGFEPRGTELSNRLNAYNNLINDPTVSSVPQDQDAVVQEKDNQLLYLNTVFSKTNTTEPIYRFKRSRRKSRQPFLFCDVPDGRWVKLVYSSSVNEDLFTLRNIRNMCKLEETFVTSNSIYLRNCLRPKDNSNCCRSLSLGNYIALLNGKQGCSNITEVDVKKVKNLVQTCVGFYKNYSLTDSCDKHHSKYGEKIGCRDRTIPEGCKDFNAVYNIMHYISDRSFHWMDQKLNFALSFLPVSFQRTSSLQRLDDAINLYLSIESSADAVGNVELVAADFGIKDQLFHHYLAKDSKWITISAIFVFFVVWLFTGSIFVTVMTFLTMFWSLELSYFLYIFVFKIQFFPYMNLVTILLIIAIGADDVFVYSKIWHLAKKERNNGTLEKLVSDTMKHASLSMFVTSFTTAGALFANVVSPITSIKCFSIYAGTTVLCNLVVMVTWTPAAIVAEEKWCNFCFINSPRFYKKLRGYYRCFFEKLLPKFVLRLRFLWIFVFMIIGIISGVLVFHHPKLRLPTSFHFQMFRNDHLMEMYDQELRENFWFEKAVGNDQPLMPLTIVWGIKNVDNGDKLNPYDKGTVEYDTSFNPSTPPAQMWLRNFCQKIRHAGFYKKVTPFEISNCFIENFILFMKRRCTNGEITCCQRNSFPYPESIFNVCIKKYIPKMIDQTQYFRNKFSPGLKFKHGKIVALVVQFSSNLTYSYNYEVVDAFFKGVNKWVHEQIYNAPIEMQNGWFTSEFSFFSIQKSLVEGLPVAFGISILVTTVATFFTSLNVLITIYAMITITFTMLVIIASLVLLNWELNILESVIITVSVGLSIDYTLHYGVAYRLAPDLDRQNRAYCAFVRVGSVIFVAAFSTFLAGIFMLPSVTLVYQKFGIFLVLVISISWIYSSLFFQSLLNVIGPQGGFGQFHWPSLDCCSMSPQNHVDRTIYTMSESTMSSSSSGYPYHPSIDTNATENDYLPDRNDTHYRTRPGRYYNRPKSESLSPDNQSERKLLNNEDRHSNTDRSDSMDATHHINEETRSNHESNYDKQCTEV
ncbi:Protein dispatched 1 [Mactra antiquata]